ncbi:MAG: DUF1467 family protein [Amylibacter sp.]
MSITAVLVLFSIVWFLILFLTLQIKIKTQGDIGTVLKGTHASSPINFSMKKRLITTTLISLPISALIIFTILSGIITLNMFDFYNLIEK